MIALNGAELRFSWMPACENDDFSACISWLVTTAPLPNLSVKASGSPAATPLPHWVAPVPGEEQVLVPFALPSQPWLDSGLTAFFGLYRHGPLASKASTNGLAGCVGTGP